MNYFYGNVYDIHVLYGFWWPGTTMTMRLTLHFAVTDCRFRVEKCRNYKCVTRHVYFACLPTVFAWIIPCLPVSVCENRSVNIIPDTYLRSGVAFRFALGGGPWIFHVLIWQIWIFERYIIYSRTHIFVDICTCVCDVNRNNSDLDVRCRVHDKSPQSVVFKWFPPRQIVILRGPREIWSIFTQLKITGYTSVALVYSAFFQYRRKFARLPNFFFTNFISKLNRWSIQSIETITIETNRI